MEQPRETRRQYATQLILVVAIVAVFAGSFARDAVALHNLKKQMSSAAPVTGDQLAHTIDHLQGEMGAFVLLLVTGNLLLKMIASGIRGWIATKPPS